MKNTPQSSHDASVSKSQFAAHHFRTGLEFTEQLIAENQLLQRRLTELEADQAALHASEDRLANLYVALYQLHNAASGADVIRIVEEVLINLIGAKRFSLSILDAVKERAQAVSSTERDGAHWLPLDQIARRAVEEGVAQFSPPAPSARIAVVPLRVESEVVGIIAVDELLSQKAQFSPVDLELFELLGGHAARALESAHFTQQAGDVAMRWKNIELVDSANAARC